MSIHDSTDKPTPEAEPAPSPSKMALAASAALQAEIDETEAVNVIDNRLGHVRATLDLIANMVSYLD